MISPDLNTRRKINDIFSLLTLIVFVSVCVLIFALGKSNIASFGFWMRLIASLLFALMGFSLIVANIGGGRYARSVQDHAWEKSCMVHRNYLPDR